jgi:hypothetical protein
MRGLYRILFLLIASGFLSPLAFGQSSPLSGTTLGKSQNRSEDLVNSLIPGPQRVGKGEKKAEVDPKTLQSKTIKDPTFQGSLNDVGLDWNGNGMGKPHGSQSTSGETDAKSAKQSDADAKKAPSKSTEATENPQGKESKSTSSKPEKQSEKQPDKGKASDTADKH